MPRHLALEFEKHKSRGDRVADQITSFTGTMRFVLLHTLFFAAWILLNVAAARYQWDPYPFNFLTLLVSLEAIFLSTFVLVVQNREAKRSDLRAQLDYEVNLKAEQEVRELKEALKAIHRELESLKRLRP